jgi:hypothetical protein
MNSRYFRFSDENKDFDSVNNNELFGNQIDVSKFDIVKHTTEAKKRWSISQ